MSAWETLGKSDEWYTPKYIFDAMDVEFDLDVAHPDAPTHVPCKNKITELSLQKNWHGFIWMNPPFGGRNGLIPWIEKFIVHGNGVCLTPDRTSAPWYHQILKKADAFLIVEGKIKFERSDGSIGVSPSTGTTLWASGENGKAALKNADGKIGVYIELSAKARE